MEIDFWEIGLELSTILKYYYSSIKFVLSKHGYGFAVVASKIKAAVFS